jgi:hypothetical protein
LRFEYVCGAKANFIFSKKTIYTRHFLLKFFQNMMTSINIYVRFGLIAAGFLLGIGLWVSYGFWYGFLFILAAIVLLVGYILLGTIQSSAMMLQAGDVAGAEKNLKLTFFPKLLFYANRSVYYMLHGTIETQKQNWDAAEGWIKQSIAAGLPTDNEKAVAYFQLANLAARKNNWQLAEKHFDTLKSLKNVTEPMIKEQTKELEKALKQRHQMKPGMMQQSGAFRPGGKRPRPRMR